MVTVGQCGLKATHYKEKNRFSNQSQHGPDYLTILKVISPDSAVLLGVLKDSVCWCVVRSVGQLASHHTLQEQNCKIRRYLSSCLYLQAPTGLNCQVHI